MVWYRDESIIEDSPEFRILQKSKPFYYYYFIIIASTPSSKL